jgi:hypothetical protein
MNFHASNNGFSQEPGAKRAFDSPPATPNFWDSTFQFTYIRNAVDHVLVFTFVNVPATSAMVFQINNVGGVRLTFGNPVVNLQLYNSDSNIVGLGPHKVTLNISPTGVPTLTVDGSVITFTPGPDQAPPPVPTDQLYVVDTMPDGIGGDLTIASIFIGNGFTDPSSDFACP